MSAFTLRMAIWAALLSVLFAASFSIAALAANFTTLIPAIWVNPLSFAPSLLLAWSCLVLMACVLDAARKGLCAVPCGLAVRWAPSSSPRSSGHG